MSSKKELTSNGLWLNKNEKKICYNPWTHFEVNNPNGDVTMCCDKPIVMGNVNKESILEIWNGQKYREARRKMFEIGGEKMCSPNCLLLNGMKNYQSFSWFNNIEHDTDIYRNAIKNEQEIIQGKEVLDSIPRWMKFTISYKCNFRCYHCDQKSGRILSETMLSDKFIEEMKQYLSYYQNLFIFGGEPTLFPQFKEILKLSKVNPYLKFGIVTNASNIEKCYEDIKSVHWSYLGVSLDAASEGTYKKLRHPKLWKKVISNIKSLSELGKINNFRLNLSMTLNSVNCHELYDFVKLCSAMNAIPEINVVSNVFGLKFQLKYLWFSEKQRRIILNHIRAISNNFSFAKNEIGLTVLEKIFDTSAREFRIKQISEVLKHTVKLFLPERAIKFLKKFKKY